MGNKMSDSELIKEITSICVLWTLGRYKDREAMKMIYKLLTEDKG